MFNYVISKFGSEGRFSERFYLIRETFTSGVMNIFHIKNEMNYTEKLTKLIPGPQFTSVQKVSLTIVI